MQAPTVDRILLDVWKNEREGTLDVKTFASLLQTSKDNHANFSGVLFDKGIRALSKNKSKTLLQKIEKAVADKKSVPMRIDWLEKLFYYAEDSLISPLVPLFSWYPKKAILDEMMSRKSFNLFELLPKIEDALQTVLPSTALFRDIQRPNTKTMNVLRVYLRSFPESDLASYPAIMKTLAYVKHPFTDSECSWRNSTILTRDKRYVKAAIEHNHNGDTFGYAAPELRRIKKYAMKIVRENGAALRHVLDGLNNDKQVVRLAGKEGFAFASETLRSNSDFVYEMIRDYGISLEHVLGDALTDRRVIRTAMARLGRDQFTFVPKTMQADKEFICELIRKYRIDLYDARLHESLDDEKVGLTILNVTPTEYEKRRVFNLTLSPHLRNNPFFLLKVMKVWEDVIYEIPAALYEEKTFLAKAFEQDKRVFFQLPNDGKLRAIALYTILKIPGLG